MFSALQGVRRKKQNKPLVTWGQTIIPQSFLATDQNLGESLNLCGTTHFPRTLLENWGNFSAEPFAPRRARFCFGGRLSGCVRVSWAVPPSTLPPGAGSPPREHQVSRGPTPALVSPQGAVRGWAAFTAECLQDEQRWPCQQCPLSLHDVSTGGGSLPYQTPGAPALGWEKDRSRQCCPATCVPHDKHTVHVCGISGGTEAGSSR